MEIIILGSGGFLETPIPLCKCKVCNSARKKKKERRIGPCVYIKDISLMIDTPEGIRDIVDSKKIIPKYVMYSHWHPDHTSGYRILEQLHYSIFEKKKPIVIIPEIIKESFEKNFKALFYFKNRGFINIKTIKKFAKINGIKITPIPMNNGFSCTFLLEKNSKKIIITMDHSKDIIINKNMERPDLLIMNLGKINYLKKGNIHKINFKDVTDLKKDNLRIIKILKPKKTVLLHIEPL